MQMFSISKATAKDFEILASIGRQSFIESHGHSAPAADIENYVNEKYAGSVLEKELMDTKNRYHIISIGGQAAGYSKIILNTPHPEIPTQNISKMERLYLLKEWYGLQLGAELFRFNLELSKRNKQAGMWLYVWKQNKRAIDFYSKKGFVVAGSYDFTISNTHSNPNHLMFLKY